ncbi:MAG TPA: GerMN domain-containing protein [Acidimicrobiia bacterium]|jgi:hypothetical protein
MQRIRVARSLVVALTALAMSLSLVASAQELDPGGTFIDDDGNVHEGNIEAIAAADVTRGCNPPDNTWFCPGEPVTRGQMAAFLNRALGLAPSADDRFSDDEGSTFENDIDALAAAGITRGCNPPINDQFCPDDFVTRGQMAAFLVRAFGYTDAGEGDLFEDDDNSVFQEDIDRLGTAGVTKGCNPPDNTWFCPSDLVLRDQMASFLARALELTENRPPPVMVAAPYFFIDEVGHRNRTGPFVAPFARRVPQTAATARASLEALLAGPTPDETNSIPGISTEIPAGTTLNSVTISNGVATVDLSAQFAADEPTESARQRAAQVVFTLTRFPSVDEVRFLEDGAPVQVRTDNGQLVSRAVNRGDYLDYQAAISVETPLYGALVDDPLRVTGDAAVFEATFEFALTDWDGRIIEEGVVMSSSGVDWGTFDFTIDYDVDFTQRGSLIVWADSAEDGSRIDIREYPLILRP